MSRTDRDQQRLREQGLRPVTFWLPDTSSPEFIAEAHTQSLAAVNSPYAKEDQDFVDGISWLNEDESSGSPKPASASSSTAPPAPV